MTIKEALQKGICDYNDWISHEKRQFHGSNPAEFTGIFYNKLITHLRVALPTFGVYGYRRRVVSILSASDIHAIFDNTWSLVSVYFGATGSILGIKGDRYTVLDALNDASKEVLYGTTEERQEEVVRNHVPLSQVIQFETFIKQINNFKV